MSTLRGFKPGQVVMCASDESDHYPVKLLKKTRIGRVMEDSQAWMDSIGQVVYERQLRQLTKRERGGG